MLKKILLWGFIFAFTFSCQKPMIQNFISPENPIITANQNFSRTGFQDFIIKDSLKLISNEDILGLPFSSFLKYSGELIFTTHNGYLYFVSLNDFDDQRKISIADGILSAPSIQGKTLFLAISKGEYGLIAYDITSAETKWTINGKFSQSSPVLTNNHVIHATLNGQILAYNLLDGTIAWQVELNDAIKNNLSKFGNTLVAAGQNGKINSYDIESGFLNWSNSLNDAVYASPVLTKEFVYIATYSGSIVKISRHDGEIIKRFEANVEQYQSPVIDNENIYIALADGKLVSLDKATLQEKWRIQLNGPFSSTPLLGTKELLVGTESRKFYRINKLNGEIIQMLNLDGRPRIQPVFYDNKIYLAYGPDYLEVYSTNGEIDE
ncbi:MAG: PQQ-binding-like beta-propeller repeat protein [Calditrichaeota bacterium]|nr:PQQ-binding-like beta-propeller repeat protein [Calditrichota bacterium]